MGGFANLMAGVAGAGQAAGDFFDDQRNKRFQAGESEKNRKYQHHENELYRWQDQHKALADAIEKAAGRYAGPEGERLRDLQMEIHSLPPLTPLLDYHKAYRMHRQSAEREVAQAAQQGARMNGGMAPPSQGPSGNAGYGINTPVVPPVPHAGMPNAPLAPLMKPMGAAQAPTSPVQPQMQTSPMDAHNTGFTGQGNLAQILARQGGGSSLPATFPKPELPSGGDGGHPGAAPPPTAQPAITGGQGAQPGAGGARSAIPSIEEFMAPSMEAYRAAGYIDPVIEAMLPEEVKLAIGQERLRQVEPYIQGIIQGEHGLPDMRSLMQAQMRLQALSGGAGGGFGNIFGPMLNAMTPRQLTGQPTVASIEATYPGFLETQGLDGLDPDTPLRVQVDKLSGRPLSAQVQSVNNRYVYGPHGELIPVNPRTNETAPPVEGAINPTFVEQTSTSTKQVPGQLPETTRTTRQRGTGAAPAAGTGAGTGTTPRIPPVSGSGGTPATGAPQSLLGRKYSDWVAGGPAPTGKELTAVQEYARQNNLPSPQPLSATGQKALATIDPILDEVKRVRETMKATGADRFGAMDFNKAYLRYSVPGFKEDTPYTDLIADLSFADLRSASQALAGTGSRAERVLNRALEHTPVVHLLNSDTGPMIMKKLDDMERRLIEAREAVYLDEKKSGVVPPLGGTGTGGGGRPAPTGKAADYLRKHGLVH